MEFGNFLEFIYFNLIAISMNFPDQLVTVICNPVLKYRALSKKILVFVFNFYRTRNKFTV